MQKPLSRGQTAPQSWKTLDESSDSVERPTSIETDRRRSLQEGLTETRLTVVRGQQQNAVMLAIVMLVVAGSAILCLAPVVSVKSLVQQSAVRQGIALAVGLIAVTLFAVGWMQRRIWERCAVALERLVRSDYPETVTVSFFRELLTIFTAAFTESVPPVQSRALATRGIPPDLEPLINQVLLQIQYTGAQLVAHEQAVANLERDHKAIQMIIHYYQKQQSVFQMQLWRTVLVEKARLGIGGLLAESLYVGEDVREATALVEAIQARDAAILRQLLHEETIRTEYAAAARAACNLFLAGDIGVRVPRRQEAERELGDLASLADGINELFVRGALQAKFLADVRQVVERSLQHPGRGVHDLDAVVELAHPGALDDTMRNLVQSLKQLFAQIAQIAQPDLTEQADQHDT